MTTVRAYHFVGDKLLDGRPVPKDGELLRFDGRPVLAHQGLHASLHPFDALRYARGATLCLVDVGGVIVYGRDKLAGTERTIVARIDARELLSYFSRMLAVSVLDKWPVQPSDCVLNFLMTGDSRLYTDAFLSIQTVSESLFSKRLSLFAYSRTVEVALFAVQASLWATASDARGAVSTAAAVAGVAFRSAKRKSAQLAAYAAAMSSSRNMFAKLVKESLG